MKEWLPVMAAALGVTLAQCKKDQGTAQAREVPAPTFTAPRARETPVTHPAFVVGVGGENGEGVCYGPPPPNPHPSANCGPIAGPDSPCSDKKPRVANLRAVVQPGGFAEDVLAKPIKEALAKILPCVPRNASGPWTHQARLVVDAHGKVKTSSSVACVVEAFDAMTLPGMDSLVIDLTST